MEGAESGLAVLGLEEEGKIDLVLTDLLVPGMSGCAHEGRGRMPGMNVETDELPDLLEMVPEIVVLVDPDRTIRFINRLGATGREPAETIGIDVLGFLPAEYEAKQKETFDRVLDTMEPASFEIPIFDVEGEEEWYEGTLTPLVREGRVTGVAVMTRNITDRRRAEQEAEALRHLVPVCSWCHRVKDEEGGWQDLESYVEEHSDSHVTHGMCPRCEAEVVGRTEDSPEWGAGKAGGSSPPGSARPRIGTLPSGARSAARRGGSLLRPASSADRRTR